MKYVPFGKTVVLAFQEIDERTPAGIIKTEQMIAEERAKLDGTATVVGVGSGCTIKIKTGDKVYIKGGAIVNSIMVGDREYAQVEEYAILGKLT